LRRERIGELASYERKLLRFTGLLSSDIDQDLTPDGTSVPHRRVLRQEAFQIFNSTPFDKNPNLAVFHIELSSTAGNGNGTSGLVEQFFENNPEDEEGVVNLRGTGWIRQHAVKRSNQNTGLSSPVVLRGTAHARAVSLLENRSRTSLADRARGLTRANRRLTNG